MLKILDAIKKPSGFTRMKPQNGDVFCVEQEDPPKSGKKKKKINIFYKLLFKIKMPLRKELILNKKKF